MVVRMGNEKVSPSVVLRATVAELVVGTKSAADVQKAQLAVPARDVVLLELGCELLADPREEVTSVGAELLRKFAAERRRQHLHEAAGREVLDEELVSLTLRANLSDGPKLLLLRELAKARVDVSAAFELAQSVAATVPSGTKPKTYTPADYAITVLAAIRASRREWVELGALGEVLGGNAIRLLLEDLPPLDPRDDELIVLARRFGLYPLWMSWALHAGELNLAGDVVLEAGTRGEACARAAGKLGSAELARAIVVRAAEEPVAAGHFLAWIAVDTGRPSLTDEVPTDVLRELAKDPRCRPHVLAALTRLCALRREALGLPVDLLVESIMDAPDQAGALLGGLSFEGEVPQAVWKVVVGFLRSKTAQQRSDAAWFLGRHARALDAKVIAKLCAICGEANASVREAAAWALARAGEAGHDISSAEAKLLLAVKKRRVKDDELKIAANVSSGLTLGWIRHSRNETNDDATRTVWIDGLLSSSEVLAIGAAERIERELELDPTWSRSLHATIRHSEDPIVARILERIRV
jgi:hypothetical protein